MLINEKCFLQVYLFIQIKFLVYASLKITVLNYILNYIFHSKIIILFNVRKNIVTFSKKLYLKYSIIIISIEYKHNQNSKNNIIKHY